MSKAFTKEDAPEVDAADANDGDDAELAAIPQGARNYMTPAGNARLKAELKKLLYEERPELVRTVQWAAGNGDRSENGDYIYGKRRLREIDRRIRFLTRRLEASEVVDPARQPTGRVLFGATVEYANEEGARKRVRIVGIDETDVARGEVSWISPIARALLNHVVGGVVTFRSPKGEEELEVLAIRYEGDAK